MEKQKKSRKALLIGVITAIVVLAALLALLLTQCTGEPVGPADSTGQSETETTTPAVAATYDLYWNVDRMDYKVESGEEVGSTGREPDADGYYHVIFAKDGEQIELRVVDRRLVNRIDGTDLMGLKFDENGIVVDLIPLDDMPLEKIGFAFYIQSVGGNAVKLNSSATFDGMEQVIKMNDNTLILDVSGWSEYVGAPAKMQKGDRVYVIANEDGDITHIFLYERDGIESIEVRYCKHCDQEVEWSSWLKKAELPVTSGHYFLFHDVVLPKQFPIKEDNAKICLDLNGHTVSSASRDRLYSTFTVGVKLAVMDNSEAKTGKMITTGKEMDQGGILWARYGSIDIYDITMDASASTTKGGGNVLAVERGAVITLHSGTVTGGTATNAGGNVLIADGGKFVMKGGTITGGSTKNANGGNIAVNGKDAVFEMSGGTISYGTAGKGNGGANGIGGNVYCSGTMTMTGGTITGGKIKDENGKFMETNSDRNMVLVNGKLNMYGGKIAGYFNTIDTSATDARTATVYVSGSAKINGAAKGHTNLSLTTRVKFELGKLNSSALISLTTTGSNKIYDRPAKMSDEQWATYKDTAGRIVSDDGFFKGVLKDDGIYFMGSDTVVHCICGANEGEAHIGTCDGTEQTWYSWGGSTLPYESGYYFLTDDVKLTTYHSYNSSSITDDAARDVYIDLNGHNITYAEGKDERPLAITTTPADISLTLTDASQGHTGKVVRIAEKRSQGMLVWLRARDTGALGTMNIYRVTMDASQITKGWYGGALVVEAGNTLNLYETTILGAEADYAGAISIEGGDVNMYGGKIVAGNVKENGGAVYLKNGSFKLAGNAQILSGENESNDVYLASSDSMTFDESWTGNGDEAVSLVLAAGMGKFAQIPEGVAEETLQAWIKSFKTDEAFSVLLDKDTLWLVEKEEEEIQLPPVTEEDGFTLTNHCVCGATVGEYHIGTCDGTAVTWTEWTSTDSMPTENGNWYLTADVTFAQDTRWMIGKTNNSKLNIDLNGHTVTYNQDMRMLTVYRDASVDTNVIITDSSADHAGKLENTCAGTTGYEGSVLYMYNGATKSIANMDIYRVTVDASKTSCDTDGGAIRVDAGHTLNLYGAKVVGCAVRNGGGIYMFGGALNVDDNTVITGAKATQNGGAIYINDGASVSIKDSAVVGADAGMGDAIYMAGSTSVLRLGGTTEISNGEVHLGKGAIITVRANWAGNGAAPVVVKLTDGSGLFVSKTPGIDLDAIKAHFAGSSSNDEVLVEEGGLYLKAGLPDGYVPVDPTSHCLCGANNGEAHIGACDGTVLTWTPWTGDTLPTESGYYYAAHEGNEVTLKYSGYNSSSITDTAERNIFIDLNGKSFVGPKDRVFAITSAKANVNLTLTDSSAMHTAKITAPARTTDNQGALAWMSTKTTTQATLNIYRIKLDASKITVTKDDGMGAGIQIEAGNTLNLYNATVIGGNVTRGGAVYVHGGTVNMEGGMLVAGSGVTGGGAVTVRALDNQEAKFIMKNSKDGSEAVIDASGKSVSNAGGAVNIDGWGGRSEFVMEGGKIIGGTSNAAGGGAVVVQDTGTGGRGIFTMNGGIITGGIAGGTASGNGGGNVRVTTGGVFYMNGGRITGGSDAGSFKAGGVLVTGNGSMTISGTANIYGNDGCDLYLNKDAKRLTINADWSGNGDGTMVVDVPNHVGKFAVAGAGATLKADSFTGVVAGNKAYMAVVKADGLYLEEDPNYDPNATEPTEPEDTEPTEPSTEPTEPSTEPTEPSTEPTEPSTEPTEPSTEPTEPSTEPTEPSTEPTEPEETLPPVMEVVTPDSHCICGATDGEYHIGNCDGVVLEWKPWTSTTSMPTENGNWYLTGNVTFTGTDRWMIGKTDNSALNVDLNGYTVSYAANIRAVTVYLESPVETNVNITDSSKGHAGKIVNGYTGDCTYAGSVLYMYGQGTKNTEKATLSFYRGTLDATNVNSNADGGTVRTEMGMTLNLFGATVKGSVAKNGGALFNYDGTVNIEDGCEIIGAQVTGNGGAIYNVGTLSMIDSVIKGAKSDRGGALHIEGGKVTMEGGKLIGADTVNNGTVIDMKPTAEASFTMKNSKKQTAIIDGTGTTAGNTGAVNIDGWGAKATFTMESGEIIGAASSKAGGGAVCVQDTADNGNNYKATFIMNGGTISGGVNNSTVDGHGGGNVRVTMGGVFNMNGGTITNGKDNGTRNAGGVMITSNGIMTISGDAKITGNADCDLYLNNTNFTVGADWEGNGGEAMNITTITELVENAVLFVKAEGLTDEQWGASVAAIRDGIASGKIVFNGTAAAEGKINGFTVHYGKDSVNLITVAENTRYSCLCGANVGESHIGTCQGFDELWTAWTATDSMPTENGNWYLTGNVTFTGDNRWMIGKTDASKLNIDLNGHTVTYSAGIRALTIYRDSAVDTHVVITDSSVGHTGKFVYDGSTTYFGSLIYMYNGATTSNATLDIYRATMDASEGTSGTDGGTLRVEVGHTMNLYGVTVLGSVTNNGSALFNYGGTVNIADGSTVTGVDVKNDGGAIYNVSTSDITANLTITDSTVNGAAAANGGAIYNAGALNITDSIINGGKVTGDGGAIYNSGTLTLKDTTVKAQETAAGTNVADNGGAIFSSGTVTVIGGEIIGGHVGTSGGAIAAHGGTFTVTDVLIDATEKVAGNRGPAVAVGNNKAVTFTMNGNTVIKGGSVPNGAPGSGAVTVQDTGSTANAQFIMNGGQIIGGTSATTNAAHGGGSIRVTSGGKFFMNGGSITGGKSANGIGGVMLTGTGTMTISGDAKIYGNDGYDLYLNNRTTTIAADWTGNGETAMVIGMATPGVFANAGEGLTFTDAYEAYFACTGKTVKAADNTLEVQ